MKPAPFDYVRPASLAEACELLAGDDDARVIAGGQTLVPMLAMRLARPARLVDILRLPELAGIRSETDSVVVGATTRQAQAERDPVIRASVPMLARLLPWVGHPPTRNRGTVGGSIANGDPSAEIPLVAMTLGAEIMLAARDGETSMPAEDFFVGPMMTTITQGSCIVDIHFPVWTGRIGVGFQEVSARRSDFALVSAAAQVALDDTGRCTDCAFAIGGAPAVPQRGDAVRAALIGSKLSDAAIADAARAAADALAVMSSPHASDAYRRRAAAALGTRALAQARDDALRQPAGTAQ